MRHLYSKLRFVIALAMATCSPALIPATSLSAPAVVATASVASVAAIALPDIALARTVQLDVMAHGLPHPSHTGRDFSAAPIFEANRSTAPPTLVAGYTFDGTDDRLEIGTVGNFGSQEKSANGWTLMCWQKTSQTSVTSPLINFSTGAQGSGNQSVWFMTQAGYTTYYVNDTNHVLIKFGDNGDTGTLWHQELSGITIADNVAHHFAVSVLANGTGAGGNASKPLVWYTDGVAATSWTKPFSDGLGTLANFTNTLAIGAHRNNGGFWFDHTAGTYFDCRVYLVNLSATEIADIYTLRGRDAVTRGLLRRWPLQGACIESVTGDTCSPQNGPTLTTVNELNGVRRR